VTSNPRRDFDLLFACPTCGAPKGVDCSSTGIVHFPRRLRAILAEKGATEDDLVKAFETGVPLKPS
jgi:hypothetical protein